MTRYTYNALGKAVSEEIYANASAAQPLSEKITVYTATGAVRSVTTDDNTVAYTYDGLGNVLTETEGEAVKQYTYDLRGRRSGYTLTVGNVQKSSAVYEYDWLDRLVSVTEGGETTTYTYDANGNRTSQTTSEVTVSYTYNKANLVTGMTNTMTNAQGEEAVISSFGYTYYTDGNMRTKTETLLNNTSATTYIYDGAGRLVSETTDGDTISYTYDARGNRVHMNNAGTVTTYSYDANNRLLSETTGGITTAYTYDANGNTLSAGSKSYTYNEWGQQTGYTDGTTTASYAYNPSGLRSAKTVGGATKYFVYNGMNIVYEYNAGGTEATVYYYGLNRTHNSDGEIYVYNAHGDVVQLVKNNAVLVSYTYDAFGNITEQIGTSENPFLYCGEYFDAETETYYLRARYYNPANGRFCSEDPIGSGLNWYTYCSNNPVMYIDPWGLENVSIRAIIEALGGSVNWDPQKGIANVLLDGQNAQFYANDKNGSYIESSRMYINDATLFAVLSSTFDLGNGWRGRIERGTKGKDYQRHVHIYSDGEEYSQNEDGSPMIKIITPLEIRLRKYYEHCFKKKDGIGRRNKMNG